MDDDRWTHGMRRLVGRSVDEAVRRHSSTVEAEHVLLAMAAEPGSTTGRILGDAGLGHAALQDALRRERMQSLRAAGVTPIDAQTLVASPRKARPTFGASVAAARDRERRNPRPAGRRRSSEIGVLIGILRAEIGTVPRALSIAGVDGPRLIEQLENL